MPSEWGSSDVHVPMNASLGVVYISVIGVAESAYVDVVTRRWVSQALDELSDIARPWRWVTIAPPG
jgi:hypothetical protein